MCNLHEPLNNNQVAGDLGRHGDVSRPQRCIFHGLQISICCATIFQLLLIEGLEYLTDVLQFSLYAKCRSFLFHAFFRTGGDDLATRSDDLLGSIGFLWR